MCQLHLNLIARKQYFLLTPRSLSKLVRAEAKVVGRKRDKDQGFIEIKQVERFTQQY
jgi:hypothetical protein